MIAFGISIDLKGLHTSSTLKMAFRAVVLAAVLAIANAGYLGAGVAAPAVYGAPAAYAAPAYAAAPVAYAAPVAKVAAAPVAYATHSVASPALVSQHSNILRTPGNLGQVSTYSKSISTPYSSVSKHDVRVSNDALAYAHAPVAYAAPVAKVAAAPVAYAAPATYAHTYAAPAAYAAPIAKVAAAPVAYAAPAAYAAHTYAAPAAYAAAPVAKAGLLGVAYSAAPAVAHMTYSNSYGIQYGW